MVSSQSNAADALEAQKLSLEIERLQLENDKLKQELRSEKGCLRTWVVPLATPISILVTLLIALTTWNNNIALQNQQAQNEFELKVAEFILNGETPSLAANRARALADLFPERFSPSFSDTLAAFAPDAYITGQSQEFLSQERRMVFNARLTILGWVWATASEDDNILDILQTWMHLVNGFENIMSINTPDASLSPQPPSLPPLLATLPPLPPPPAPPYVPPYGRPELPPPASQQDFILPPSNP